VTFSRSGRARRHGQISERFAAKTLQGKIEVVTISKVDCGLLKIKVSGANQGNPLPFREWGSLQGFVYELLSTAPALARG